MRIYIQILLIFIFCYGGISFSQDDENELSKYEINKIKIEFKNTKSFKNGEIKALLKSSKNKFFIYDDFITDILRIEKFYFDNGYFDTFVDTSLSINEKDKEVDLKYIIDERNHYLINKIDYIGLSEIAGDLNEKLFSPSNVLINLNQIYKKISLAQEVIRVVNFLNNNGYANAKSEPPEIIKIQSQESRVSNKINLVLKFNAGKRYTFGKTKIDITGNIYDIKIKEVYRELEYDRNNIFSKEKLIESENRIAKIAILDNPRLQVDYIDTINNIINLKVVTKIRKKYELQPEILGYDINNRFYGGVGLSFSDRYFFGGGRTLNTSLRGLVHDLDINGTEFILKIFQPYIFKNNKITGVWTLSNKLFNEDFYRILQVYSQFDFNYELPKHTYVNNLSLNWKIAEERYTVKGAINSVKDTASGTYLPPGFTFNTFSSILGFTVTHNNTDNFQFPTRGFFQSYLVEESGLLGRLIRKMFETTTFSYIKLTTVNKIFMDVTKNSSSILANKILVGAIFEYGDNSFNYNGTNINFDIVPIESRFIAGGNTSVRGWPSKGLGTFPGSDFGGNFLVEGNLEHRTKPFIDSKGFFKDFGFVTFVDYGNLWETPAKFRLSQMAIAIGAGIRYYTIVGPIRIDVGFKFHDYYPDAGTKDWLFQNSLANIFSKKLTFQFGIGNTF